MAISAARLDVDYKGVKLNFITDGNVLRLDEGELKEWFDANASDTKFNHVFRDGRDIIQIRFASATKEALFYLKWKD